MPILVDCDWGKKNQSISGKYGVNGYPNVLFTDPNGKEVDRMSKRDARSIIKQINALASKYRARRAGPVPGAPLAWVDKYDEAFETAKKLKQPILVFLTDGKKDAKAMEAVLGSKTVEDLVKKFVLVRHEIGEKCKICEKHKVKKGSNLRILDSGVKDPYKKPISKIAGKRTDKALRSSLKSALRKWEKIQKSRR